MLLVEIEEIVKDVLPKIQSMYGESKYYDTTPYIEYEDSIYDISEGEELPDGEFNEIENSIVLYYPKMKTKENLIKTLIHEYQHYLQSPLWMKRYYTMGHTYESHPYEVAAVKEEKNYKLFL